MTQIILTVTTGRSGTGYLQKLFSHVPTVHAEHELSLLLEPFWKKRFDLIEETKTPIYVETSHLISKGFIEPLIEQFNVVPDLILLSRDSRDVSLSMVALDSVPERTINGRTYLISYLDSKSLTTLPTDKEYTDYQLCYWYCLEIAERQKHYKQLVESLGGKTYSTTIDKLRSGDFNNLLAHFGIDQIDLDQTTLSEKVNQKLNIKKDVIYTDAELSAQEQEIEKDIIIK